MAKPIRSGVAPSISGATMGSTGNTMNNPSIRIRKSNPMAEAAVISC